MNTPTLREKTKRGLVWASAEAGARTVLQTLVLIVLSRLLTPGEYGVVGAALIVVGIASIFSQLGVGPAIVQRPEIEPRHLNAAFLASILFGLITAGVIYLGAPLLSKFFNMPSLIPALHWLVLIFPITSFGVVSESLLQRELRFDLIARAEVVSYVVGSGAVSIVLAKMGWGIYALVAGQIVQMFVRTGMLFALQGWWPGLSFNMGALQDLRRFSGGITLARLANYVATTGDNMVVGRYLGANALGIYGRAYQLMSQPANLVGNVLEKVLFPAMAKMQTDDAKLAGIYRKGVGLLATAMFPGSAMIYVLAPEIVQVLLGRKWGGVVFPLQIFSAALLFRTSMKMSNSLLRAKGAVYQMALCQIIYAAATVAFAYAGQFWGISGVCVGVFASIIFCFAIGAAMSLQLVGVTWLEYFMDHLPGLLLTAVVGGCGWLTATVLRQQHTPPMLILFVTMAAMSIPALACAWLLPRFFLGPDGPALVERLRKMLNLAKLNSAKAAPRLEELDVLRGIAAVGIMFFHYTIRYAEVFAPGGPPLVANPLGKVAVHLFFMISGFVIFMTLSKTRTAGDFLVSRFSRLFPVYWVAVLLTFTVIKHWPLEHRTPHLPQLLINLTMLQSWLRVPDVDGVYWTLAVELSFYAIMLAVFLAGWLKRIEWLVLPWLCCEGVWAWLKQKHDLPKIVETSLLLSYAHLFLAGIVFYRIRKDGATLVRHGLLACCLAMHWWLNGWVAALFAAGFFAAFYAMVFNRLKWAAAPPLVFLGTISYSLYLVHQNIGFVVMRSLSHWPRAAQISMAAFVAVLLATLLTFLVERPALRAIRALRKKTISGGPPVDQPPGSDQAVPETPNGFPSASWNGGLLAEVPSVPAKRAPSSLKAAILTYHDTPNYGATLQCYALSRFLQQAGAKVEVINYTPLGPLYQYSKSMFFGRRRHVQNFERVSRFWQFVSERLPLSGPPILSRAGLRQFSRRYDLAIVGSDEVWRVDGVRPLDPSFYLDFCDAGHTHLASYAASCSSITNRTIHATIARPLLERFSGISVRDPHTAALVQDLTGETPAEVLDPTFLWNFAEENLPPAWHEPYIAVYAYLRPAQMRAVRELAAARRLKVVSVGVWNKGSDATFLNIGPMEWMSLIKHAELVITNYFHGAVFSIIFKRRHFTFLDPQKSGKLRHLFAQTGQQQFLHQPEDIMNIPKIDLAGCEPDYAEINRNLAAPLQRSLDFLSAQLEAVGSRRISTALQTTVKAIQCTVLALAGLLTVSLNAAEYHVDAAQGNDTRDGLAEKSAWLTIGKAAKSVAPGDVVIVHPGVYFEHVSLETPGTKDQPITFRASDAGLNKVIISGAVPAIRKGEAIWKVEDAASGLYSTPVDHLPARVLADEVNLFPYQSLAALQSLQVADHVPGPRHGYFYDASAAKLYVRLHTGGKYGSRKPADHVMKVSPVTGSGGNGRHVAAPEHFNFGVMAPGEAYVVIDGFTFETPGVAGVFSKGNHVTVRNCWFRGCRTAVSGRSDTSRETERTNDLTIEYCDFTLFPAFEDVVEVVDLARAQVAAGGPAPPPFYWWHRKNGKWTDEIGLALKIGSRWRVRGNRIHDVIDGLSTWGVSSAKDLDISGNLFELVVDNAVETENFARRVLIHNNVIKDAFEPFSWQPLAGAPWPGPVWIYHNLVYDSPEVAPLWPKLDWERGCFKIVCTDENWDPPSMNDVPDKQVAVPDEGFVVAWNTIWMPGGNVFSLGGLLNREARNFHFINNMVVTSGFLPKRYVDVDLRGFEFASNITAPSVEWKIGPTKIFAGTQGRHFKSYTNLGFANPEAGDFTVTGDNPPHAGAFYGKGELHILSFGPGAEAPPPKASTP